MTEKIHSAIHSTSKTSYELKKSELVRAPNVIFFRLLDGTHLKRVEVERAAARKRSTRINGPNQQNTCTSEGGRPELRILLHPGDLACARPAQTALLHRAAY
jgi:hypothetical protein